MMILSVKEGTGSDVGDPVVRIGLSDGSLFSFKPVYVAPAHRNCSLEPGGELSANEEGAFRFAAACYRTEKLALQLVARAEQNSRGLARKLEQRRQKDACIRAVLARLEGLEIVSDRRFAELWIRSRLSRRSVTPRRLEAGLRARGIGREIAAGALKKILDSERELAMLRAYLEKKRLIFDEEHKSLKYQLKAEGFSGAVLSQYLE